jgi:hypothetical protein
MKKRVPTIVFKDANWELKAQLTLISGDPYWMLEIVFRKIEEKVRETTDAERLRLLNLKYRWLRLEMHKMKPKSLVA